MQSHNRLPVGLLQQHNAVLTHITEIIVYAKCCSIKLFSNMAPAAAGYCHNVIVIMLRQVVPACRLADLACGLCQGRKSCSATLALTSCLKI